MGANIESITLEDRDEKISSLVLDLNDKQSTEQIAAIGKALSSPIRLEIIKQLQIKKCNYSELARLFDLPVSTVAFHINILEQAGLVSIGNMPEHKGHIRWCSYAYPYIMMILREAQKTADEKMREYNIGIGDYILFEPINEWGLGAPEGQIAGNSDGGFIYTDDRRRAQILWCNGGKVVYPVPPSLFDGEGIKEIRISLEISSNTMGYSNYYPSDITYSIDGTELCTDISLGDYGDRYGLYTPKTWYGESTKYGVLKVISVKRDGVYVNEKLVNKKINVSFFSARAKNNTLFFGIENKPDSPHPGGFNIFGEKFGDYPQAIKINVFYNSKNRSE